MLLCIACCFLFVHKRPDGDGAVRKGTEEAAKRDGRASGYDDVKATDGRIQADTESSTQVTDGETESQTTQTTETADAKDGKETKEQTVAAIIAGMTLEEKIAQMFLITPEALTGYRSVTAAGEATRQALWDCPVGGLIYFAGNIQSADQVREMTQAQQSYAIDRIGLPLFLAVDEEGGKVARIANESSIDVARFPEMPEIGAAPDAMKRAQELGDGIGGYLKDLGFNLDFAPVADVLTNPDNTVIKQRTFGSDAQQVAELAVAVSSHLERQGVSSCLKHFPGHGATAGDSHQGFAYTDKSLEELQEAELIPFWQGIASGVSFIMAGHISAPNVTGDDTPASLSKRLLTDLLRNEMQFDGIIVTDAMNMKAIAGLYSSAQAAEQAILAGVDMILMPVDFQAAYQGVCEAVEQGRISENRIDASVKRIVGKKWEWMQTYLR